MLRSARGDVAFRCGDIAFRFGDVAFLPASGDPLFMQVSEGRAALYLSSTFFLQVRIVDNRLSGMNYKSPRSLRRLPLTNTACLRRL